MAWSLLPPPCSPRRQAMKETQAKMKSLARKVFSTVQQKSTALPKINADFLGFSPSVSGGGGERVMDHEGRSSVL